MSDPKRRAEVFRVAGARRSAAQGACLPDSGDRDTNGGDAGSAAWSLTRPSWLRVTVSPHECSHPSHAKAEIAGRKHRQSTAFKISPHFSAN